MTPPFRRPIRRPNMRRAVFLFPSGLTLLNLFFGIYAIIAASRLEFTMAGVFVVIGGICDALDGRVARATNAGTEFGEELDSLVDAITFGLAPGMIMYFAVLNRGGWDWVWVFAFAAAAVLRLARFNIEQAGTAKTYFQGLPSPAAGITLASYYWFSQSSLYTYGAIANLNWHITLRLLMAVLAALMFSNVPYPTFPRTGFRSLRAIGSSVVVFGSFALLLTGKLEYFFPIAVLYVAFGLLRWLFAGLFERRQPTLPYDLSEGEDDEDEEDDFELAESRVHASRLALREEVARQERASRAGGRLDRASSGAGPARPEPRAERPRKPDRPEKAERGERPDRSATAAERPAEGERGRRDKKKDRPKGADRPERADRPDRPERPPRAPRPEGDAPAPAAAAAVPAPERAPAPVRSTPPLTGVDAITLGEPDVALASGADDDELLAGEEGSDTDGGAENGAPAVPGAPARKRKRRRRRGERKERGPGERPASPDSEGAASGAVEADSSPYASAPTAYAPPMPSDPTPPPVAAPAAASPPPLPQSSPSPSPSPSSSSAEPSE